MTSEADLSVAEDTGGLRAEKLRKSFRKRPVIRDVSMTLQQGEVVALLGPNGSGKTTTFYSIAGLVFPEAGRVTLDGQDLTALPMYRRARLGIGYLPQEVSIFRGLNVEDNIAAILEISCPDRGRRQERLEQLLSDFAIERLRRTPALSLSGGERRRVEITRALACRPSFMLLDEPFAGIDPLAVADIQSIIGHLQQRGIGVLITDHNVRETLQITDRAYIISQGRILEEGQPAELATSAKVRRFYLGDKFQL